MSSLSVITLFSSVSRGPSRGRPMAVDVRSNDDESSKNSSRAVGSLSRDNLKPAMSSSSSLSVYEGEETREADYVWVDNKVREVFSKYTEVSMLQTFVESVDIVLKGVLNGALEYVDVGSLRSFA